MTQSPNAAVSDEDKRPEQLRDMLHRALNLMDELQPASIPAARLQQIVDEFDDHFGAPGRSHA